MLPLSSLSVVIPVYNSAEILPKLLSDLELTLKKISKKYEIILVNDGSIDNSQREIIRLAKKNKRIIAFELLKNYGQHNAILCGIKNSRHKYILTIDDDLQHPPKEIHKLVKILVSQPEVDLVYGYPIEEKQNLWRNIASQFTKAALAQSFGINNANRVSAFRIFKKDLIKAFENYNSSFVSIDVLLSWGSRHFVAVPVKFNNRYRGHSNYTFLKLVSHALNMVTGYSVLPLRFASLLGFIFMAFGFSTLIYVLVKFFWIGRVVPGFSFLASMIALFSGVQLFALGLMGEYLARIYFKSLNKPQYVIKRIIK